MKLSKYKFFVFKGKKGFGTIEIVLIIAVLITLALIFRTAITSYTTRLISSVFNEEIEISQMESDKENH